VCHRWWVAKKLTVREAQVNGGRVEAAEKLPFMLNPASMTERL